MTVTKRTFSFMQFHSVVFKLYVENLKLALNIKGFPCWMNGQYVSDDSQIKAPWIVLYTVSAQVPCFLKLTADVSSG